MKTRPRTYEGFPKGVEDAFLEFVAKNTTQYGTTANALAAELLATRKELAEQREETQRLKGVAKRWILIFGDLERRLLDSAEKAGAPASPEERSLIARTTFDALLELEPPREEPES